MISGNNVYSWISASHAFELIDHSFTVFFKTDTIPDRVFQTLFSLSWYHILPNKRTCLNKHAPDFWLYQAISQKPLNWSEALIVNVFMRSCSKFHWNLTRVRARFLLLCLVHLFSEIQYICVSVFLHFHVYSCIWAVLRSFEFIQLPVHSVFFGLICRMLEQQLHV